MSMNISVRIPDDVLVLERPIRELQLPDGCWQLELRRDVPADGPFIVGPFRLAGGVAVSAHITPTASPPVGVFVGDPAEREVAWVSLLIQSHAVTALDLEPAPLFGRAGGAGGGAFRWVQHRRVSQDLTVRRALTDLLANLKSPYDPGDAARLEDGEVLEVRRDTAANAALAVTWDAVVLRELVPAGRVRVTPGEPLQLHSGVAAAVTTDMRVAGRLTFTVERGDRGAGWVRLRVRHHHQDVAGAGLRISAAALPQGLDTAARVILEELFGSADDPAAAGHLGSLAADLAGRVLEQVREGATASLGAALNRTRGREALADFQFRLPERRAEFLAAVGRGDLGPAQQRAGEPGEPGVLVASCLLQQHLRRHRTVTVNLRLLGLALDREAGRLAGVRLTRGTDGALWFEGQAAATLSRRTRRQIEDMTVLFDLHAAAGHGAGVSLSASLERTTRVARGVRTALAAARRHLAVAVALGCLEGEAADQLLRKLAVQPLPYTFRFAAAFPPQVARRLFALDDPGFGPSLYRARLWAVYSTAVRLLGLTVPTVNPRRPCPMWRLITEERIAAIRRQPFLAVEPHRLPPLAAEGYRFDRGAPTRGFWLHLAHAHTFIEATAAARRNLQRARPPEELGRTVSSLANLAGRLRDQVGWLGGPAGEDRHLTLPLLVGADHCDLRLTFTRGDLNVTF